MCGNDIAKTTNTTNLTTAKEIPKKMSSFKKQSIPQSSTQNHILITKNHPPYTHYSHTPHQIYTTSHRLLHHTQIDNNKHNISSAMYRQELRTNITHSTNNHHNFSSINAFCKPQSNL